MQHNAHDENVKANFWCKRGQIEDVPVVHKVGIYWNRFKKNQ